MIPTVQVVARYGERDSELKTSVIKAVLANSKLSANFLGYAYDENDVEKIIDFFRNDMSALASIYMNAIETDCHIDYRGKLFAKIFEKQPTVWKEYVDWRLNVKKKLVVVGMLAAIAGVVAVFKSRKKYTKVRKNY